MWFRIYKFISFYEKIIGIRYVICYNERLYGV